MPEKETTEAATEQPQPPNGNGAELELAQDDELELLPPAQTPSSYAQVTLHQHAANMQDAYRLADGICYTSMVPDRFRGKPKDGAAAILFGAELGLTPIQSLQRVIVIHGTPGLEARTMKALLKAQGYGFRTVESTPTAAEIWAWEPGSPREYNEQGRRINPDEESRWTMEDAQRAGYVPTPSSDKSKQRPDVQDDWVTFSGSSGKKSVAGNMKYITEPKAMLKAKATAEVCRDIAPHILLGLPLATEELENWREDEDERPQERREPKRGGGVEGLRERAHRRQHKAETKPEPVDAEVVEPEPEQVSAEEQERQKADANAHADKLAAEAAPETSPAEEQPAGSEAQPASNEPSAGEPPAAEPEAEPGMFDDSADEAQAAPAAEPETPAEEPDLEMSSATRTKGMDMLKGLLINGKVTEPLEQLDAVAEIMAKREGAGYRKVTNLSQLTNRDLKHTVDALRTWKSNGKLEANLGEALNASSLREAGLLEKDAG